VGDNMGSDGALLLSLVLFLFVLVGLSAFAIIDMPTDKPDYVNDVSFNKPLCNGNATDVDVFGVTIPFTGTIANAISCISDFVSSMINVISTKTEIIWMMPLILAITIVIMYLIVKVIRGGG
jgi:hypothetical protein